MASFSPASELSRVDLPALGRPMMVTNPERTLRCYSTGPGFGKEFGGICEVAFEVALGETEFDAGGWGAAAGGAGVEGRRRTLTFSTRRAVDSSIWKTRAPSCTDSAG